MQNRTAGLSTALPTTPVRPRKRTIGELIARYWQVDAKEATGILHEIVDRFKPHQRRLGAWSLEEFELALTFFFTVGDEVRIIEQDRELRGKARALIARRMLVAASFIITEEHGKIGRNLFDRIVGFYADGPIPSAITDGYIEKEDDRTKIRDFLSIYPYGDRFVDAIFATGSYELLLKSWNFAIIPRLATVQFPNAVLASDWKRFPEIEHPSNIFSGTMLQFRELLLELDATLQPDIVELASLIAHRMGGSSSQRGADVRRAALSDLFQNFLRLRHALLVKDSPCRQDFGTSGPDRERLWAQVTAQ